MRVDVKTNTVLYNFSTRFGNCVSKVCIYPEKTKNVSQEVINQHSEEAENNKKGKTKWNLVVVNSIHPAVIFQYIFRIFLFRIY